MTSIYDAIAAKAKPYFDTRDNDIHISLSYEFALRLLNVYLQANADIVLPAILLHDIGWKVIPEDKHSRACGPIKNNKETQRVHELEAVRMAEGILKSIDYDAEKIKEILSVIDGHDTRGEAHSLNDALVKDADKLWRYTSIAVDIISSRFGMDREDYMNKLEQNIDKWFYTDAAKEMAAQALADARAIVTESAPVS